MPAKKSRRIRKAVAVSTKKISQGTAIAAFVLNVVVPGIGTLLSGRVVEGIWQLLLLLAGVLLLQTVVGWYIGVAFLVAVWIWSIVRGVKILNEAFK